MFGDCDNYVDLSFVIIPGAGLPYGIVQPGEDGSGDLPIIRNVDLQINDQIDLQSLKHIDPKLGEQYKRTMLGGSELLVTVNGTTGKIMLTNEMMKGMNVSRGIAVVRYDSNIVDPLYLRECLRQDDVQQYIQVHTKGAALKSITLADLSKTPIKLPAIIDQNKFASFVQQVDKSKFVFLCAHSHEE